VSAARTRLLIWRHGETAWNAEDRVQGQIDLELNELGVAQAARAAAALADQEPDAVVSSDLRRAADTAAALASLTGLTVHYDPRLRERYFGDWQGLTNTELAERYPAERARWRAAQVIGGCGVEELDDLTKRATAALLEAAELAPGGTVVVTCHGGTAKYGVGALLGWPAQVLASIGPLGNCRWIELHSHPVRGWRLHGYNLG
jgi:probable phosphoglycerate mutase